MEIEREKWGGRECPWNDVLQKWREGWRGYQYRYRGRAVGLELGEDERMNRSVDVWLVRWIHAGRRSMSGRHSIAFNYSLFNKTSH